jgi:plasmid replication initiation protein
MIKDPNLVKYSNKVVRSAQRLSLLEQRILYSAIAKTPSDRQITYEDVFYLRLEDLRRLGGAVSNHTYQQLKDAAINLMRRLITLAPKDREKGMTWVFPWCHAAGYNEEKGMIAVQFSPRIIPFLKEVKERFIQYDLEEITGFRSVYTQPLYARLMLHMRNKDNGGIKQRWSETIPLDELRPTLDAEKFDKFFDLKRRVLEPACKQINESVYTRFNVKWAVDEDSKIGKRVTAIRFSMSLKPHLVADPEPDTDTVDWVSGLTRRQATLTEHQIVMVADWLSGKNKTVLEKHGTNASEVYEFLRRQKQIPARLDANNPDEYKKWLRKKLIDPEFVMLISPILKKLEFNFGNQ